MTHQDYLKQIGLEIKIARIRKNMTVQQVSKLTGLCKDAINRIENGKVDSKILSYKRIVDALDADMKTIL
jgi:transcriptional regulator with XRE-family HTH domain